MASITLKSGTSLIMPWAFQNSDGTPTDITNLTISAQVRDSAGHLITTLVFSIVNAVGGIASTPVDTTAWPIGNLVCDVKTTSGSLVSISDSFTITTVRSVTL